MKDEVIPILCALVLIAFGVGIFIGAIVNNRVQQSSVPPVIGTYRYDMLYTNGHQYIIIHTNAPYPSQK